MTDPVATGTGHLKHSRVFNWRPIIIGFLAVASLSALFMAYVDEPAARYFRDAFDAEQRRFLGHTLGALGKPDVYFAICAVVALVCWLLNRKATDARPRLKRLMHASLFVVLSVIAAGGVVNRAKFIIGRVRPRELFNDGVYGFLPFNTDFGMNSYPSGHSQMVWSLAVALFVAFPRLWPVYVTFATVIAASRFLASVHYVSDVMMGAYIGAVIPLILKHYVYDARGIDLRPKPPGSPAA